MELNADICLVIGIIVCILDLIAKLKSDIEFNNILHHIDADDFKQNK